MKYMMTISLNKLFFIFSIIVLIGFITSSMATRVESFHTVQEDAATAIANTCAALIESCARQPALCGLTEPPEPPEPPVSPILVDLYNDAVGEIMALNLEYTLDDIALAKGIMKASLITAVARQPELQEELVGLEAMCNEDIEAL